MWLSEMRYNRLVNRLGRHRWQLDKLEEKFVLTNKKHERLLDYLDLHERWAPETTTLIERSSEDKTNEAPKV